MTGSSLEEFDQAFGSGEAQESIDRAFGRGPAVEGARHRGAADDSIARAFGDGRRVDESVLRDLEEAGFTPGGASGVLLWLREGASVEVALGGGLNAIQNGGVRSFVEARGLEVLQRHGLCAAPTSAPSALEDGGARVDAARERLIEAYRKAWPRSDARAAEIYADAAVTARLESAARNGWSTDQIVEALDRQAPAEAGRAADAQRELAERRGAPASSSRPISQLIHERKARYDREARR